MASYLAYFTSSNNPQSNQSYQGQSQQQQPQSTWSSSITSRLTGLRKALTKDSEEDDPDNPDCSHVSNVLRAYFTEKGRVFPEWLPPDPTKPAPQIPPPQAYANYGGYGSNAAYGNQNATHGRGGGSGGSGRGGGLSDLWDSSPVQQQAPPTVQSLRGQRPTAGTFRSTDSGLSFTTVGSASPPAPEPSSRLLPSQLAGSRQNIYSPQGSTGAVAGAAAGALGSRDRLRARLQGGGSGRNSPVAPGSSSGSGSYGQSAGSGSYNSQGGGSPSPYVAAAEPWSTGGPDNYGSGYGSGGGGRASPYGDPRQKPGAYR